MCLYLLRSTLGRFPNIPECGLSGSCTTTLTGGMIDMSDLAILRCGVLNFANILVETTGVRVLQTPLGTVIVGVL
jgi:hypothetical protein